MRYFTGNKIKMIGILLTLVVLSGCMSISINEDTFLRPRTDTILYTMITTQQVTATRLAQITGYPVSDVKKSLNKLLDDGFVFTSISEDQLVWSLSDKQLHNEADYIEKVKGFSIQNINKKSGTHNIAEHYFDDKNLYYVSILAKNPEVIIVFFGGNGFRINPEVHEVITSLIDKNTSLYLMDYRGIGNSKGKPSIASMGEDAVDFVTFVNQKRVTGTRVIYYGMSLGSFVATYAASKVKPDALILESTATNLDDWIEFNIPWYAKWFLNVDVSPEMAAIDNTKLLPELGIPVLILTGTEDKVTPSEMAQVLCKSIKKNNHICELQTFVGAGHTDINSHSQYRRVIDGFIAKTILTTTSKTSAAEL